MSLDTSKASSRLYIAPLLSYTVAAMLPSAIPFELPIQRLLYISRLAPSTPPRDVGLILRQAREHNRVSGIGGVLVFDGERFCQLLEGTPDTVDALAGRIEQDDRHCSFHVLYNVIGSAPRLMPQMQTGYAEPELFNPLDGTQPMDPAQALALFMRTLKLCDLSF